MERLRRLGLAQTIGLVPRATSIALQCRASVLLLITSADASQTTGKLFEYLAANRPILALAENEAARIVRETNTGVTVPPRDVDAIAAALRDVASGKFAQGYDPRRVERYTYPAPAEDMAEAVEAAITRRAQGRATGR